MSARSSTRIEIVALTAALLAPLGACSRESPGAAPDEAPLKVAAASDLALAFEEVGAAYSKETGKKVVFSFGSTGMYAKQIDEGAPFDVFAAANVKFVDEVVAAGRCRGDTRTLYARGRIVLFAREGAPLPEKIADLADPKFVKIAIANPEHAPYGLAARQALESAGVWDTVKPRLVYGENILQTKQFADSGNADVAIVALSLAIETRHALVPAEAHAPLDQALVVCAGDERRATATAFADWVGSEKGRTIMRSYGFLLPGESIAKAP
jgi:molybdate transport system substrate-binding protein